MDRKKAVAVVVAAVLVFVLVFSLLAYRGYTALKNLKPGQDVAEVVDKFYEGVGDSDISSSFALLDRRIDAETKAKNIKMYSGIYSYLGDLKSYELADWGFYTFKGVGTQSYVRYSLLYNVTYSNCEVQESFILMKYQGMQTYVISSHRFRGKCVEDYMFKKLS